MLRFLGGALAIALVAAAFAGSGSYTSATAFSDGFAAAIGLCAGLSLLGAIAGMALPTVRPVPQAAAAVPAR
jgi:hypothetical protein